MFGRPREYLDRKENWFNPEQILLLNEALDMVEMLEGDKALVITAKGKFFSNGLDIAWGQAQKNPADFSMMVESVWRFLSRLLVLHCPTVAAINGHAFGAGLFLALACDWRVMRTEKGFLNFPEVNLGMRLSKAFAELSKSKLSTHTLRVGVLTGKRFDSKGAIGAGIVDDTCAVEVMEETAVKMAVAVLPSALKFAMFSREKYSQMKKELYTDAYRALTEGMSSTLPEARL